MFGLGAGEILVVLVLALIFIGPKKLPELAKNLGKGIRDFQNALKGEDTSEDPKISTKSNSENKNQKQEG